MFGIKLWKQNEVEVYDPTKNNKLDLVISKLNETFSVEERSLIAEYFRPIEEEKAFSYDKPYYNAIMINENNEFELHSIFNDASYSRIYEIARKYLYSNSFKWPDAKAMVSMSKGRKLDLFDLFRIVEMDITLNNKKYKFDIHFYDDSCKPSRDVCFFFNSIRMNQDLKISIYDKISDIFKVDDKNSNEIEVFDGTPWIRLKNIIRDILAYIIFNEKLM